MVYDLEIEKVLDSTDKMLKYKITKKLENGKLTIE